MSSLGSMPGFDTLDSLIRTIGAASTVLLKNTDNALPLVAPKTIAIIGNGAGNSSKGPNGYVLPHFTYNIDPWLIS